MVKENYQGYTVSVVGYRVTLANKEAYKEQVLAPALTRADLLEAIHCVARDGRIHRGARALRFIGLRMPLALPVALVLWIPGVIWVAEKIYAWVSRHRLWLSRLFGCKEACAIMPMRERANEKNAQVKP